MNDLLLGSDKASWHAGYRIAAGDRVIFDIATHGVVLANDIVVAAQAETAASDGFGVWGAASA